MRLLNTNNDGSFSLTWFANSNIPDYAILSHAWEKENQELTFQDMMNGLQSCQTMQKKKGYQKIKFCAEQAKRDGLNYFWVDSCAIDKSSSSELTEAINSMYRWYRNAKKCYVYLSDVSASSLPPESQAWKSNFSQSRWFTRGWTLQELLAPSIVEFFSEEGTRLGDKLSLEQDIHKITLIPIPALRGATPLSQFSIEERMSWTKNRQTTIEEDQAYCLLGIFDIHLPLIYGEGVESAFVRLQQEIERRLPGRNTRTSLVKRFAQREWPHELNANPDIEGDEERYCQARRTLDADRDSLDLFLDSATNTDDTFPPLAIAVLKKFGQKLTSSCLNPGLDLRASHGRKAAWLDDRSYPANEGRELTREYCNPLSYWELYEHIKAVSCHSILYFSDILTV
jgi:hypothetical protein